MTSATDSLVSLAGIKIMESSTPAARSFWINHRGLLWMCARHLVAMALLSPPNVPEAPSCPSPT